MEIYLIEKNKACFYSYIPSFENDKIKFCNKEFEKGEKKPFK